MDFYIVGYENVWEGWSKVSGYYSSVEMAEQALIALEYLEIDEIYPFINKSRLTLPTK